MNNIITSGLGKLQKLITQGFAGFSIPRASVHHIITRTRVSKVYELDFYSKISMSRKLILDLKSKIIKQVNKIIDIKSSVLVGQDYKIPLFTRIQLRESHIFDYAVQLKHTRLKNILRLM
jgi:hypothetical protein